VGVIFQDVGNFYILRYFAATDRVGRPSSILVAMQMELNQNTLSCERSLIPHQVYFPMAGKKDVGKLRKAIRAEMNEDLQAPFERNMSMPVEAGHACKVEVKEVDDRGVESLKLIRLT
jgi:hypothetical protein